MLHAAALDLSDTPITITTSVNPNVMILFDNSGSMSYMAWGGNYDTGETYESWCGDCNSRDRWSINELINLRRINGRNADGSCSTSNTPALPDATILDTDTADPLDTMVVPRYVVQGEDSSGTLKCLILPDPDDGGNTVYSGHYLNYLFQTYADGTDLTQVSADDVSKKTRIQLARDVMSRLVMETGGMNFGLSVFANGRGASIDQSCNEVPLLTSDKIVDIDAGGYTPLGEAMYEITRYFRGLDSAYGYGGYDSPITHRCQKNYVIVVTDGYPTNDTELNFTSANDPDIEAGCNSDDGSSSTPPCLPDWDELHPATTQAEFPNFAAFSDGFHNAGEESNEGYTLYLDDIAKFAYDIDLMSNPPKAGSSASALDENGVSFDDPHNEKQNIETYTIGFSVANQMLEDAAYYGSGKVPDDPRETDPDFQHYFTATSGGDLRRQLEQAFSNIEGQNSSSAAVSASSGFVSGNTNYGTAYIFQGTLNSENWSGNLYAYAINQTTGDVSAIPEFNASEVLSALLDTGSHNSRNILSYNPTNKSGIEFNWDSLDASQQAYFDNRQEVLNFIRGSQQCETSSTETCPSGQTKNLRDRNTGGEGFLGTFVGSSPVYIAQPPFLYPDEWPNELGDPENVSGAEKYSRFKKDQATRKALIYVGSNDGMLHAFDGGYPGHIYDPATHPAIDPTLEEIFAYIPNAVIPKLIDHSKADYQHRYYVDATPTIIDVFFNSDKKWHTVLVGGLNKGGQGIYALDVTNAPTSFDETNVLWEFTDSYDDASSAEVEGADLGYTYSRPAIVRMQNGKWAAVFGNGYNNTATDSNSSTTGHAALYIVDIETGELIRKIDTEEGSLTTPNGLATVAPIDIDNDYKIDFIYAGDLYGNLWRFDVTDGHEDNWTILGRGANPTIQPLFKAVNEDNRSQPISSRPEVSRAGGSGVMIFFGTGLYLQEVDKTTEETQTFYGLLDDPLADHINYKESSPEDILAVLRENMHSSTIVTQTAEYRDFSPGPGTSYVSWYLDLPDTGERVVGSPLVRGRKRPRVIFSSIIPTPGDSCDYGGSSWLNELDARNGGKTSQPVFDLDGDGDPSNDDIYNGVHYSGIQTTPTVVAGDGKEFKYMSNSAAASSVTKIIESEPPDRQGRVSWRQIK